jgi:hypothetical protein
VASAGVQFISKALLLPTFPNPAQVYVLVTGQAQVMPHCYWVGRCRPGHHISCVGRSTLVKAWLVGPNAPGERD